jgi:hypothetical protein
MIVDTEVGKLDRVGPQDSAGLRGQPDQLGRDELFRLKRLNAANTSLALHRNRIGNDSFT